MNIDDIEVEDEDERDKATENEEEWRTDWNTETVRTNANKYNDENFLMNSPSSLRPIDLEMEYGTKQYNSSAHMNLESHGSAREVKTKKRSKERSE